MACQVRNSKTSSYGINVALETFLLCIVYLNPFRRRKGLFCLIFLNEYSLGSSNFLIFTLFHGGRVRLCEIVLGTHQLISILPSIEIPYSFVNGTIFVKKCQYCRFRGIISYYPPCEGSNEYPYSIGSSSGTKKIAYL